MGIENTFDRIAIALEKIAEQQSEFLKYLDSRVQHHAAQAAEPVEDEAPAVGSEPEPVEDEAPETGVSVEKVREALAAAMDVDRAAPKRILKKLGADRLSDLAAADYSKVIDMAHEVSGV